MEKASGLVVKVLLTGLTVPVLNKWTTVSPCISRVAAMQQFCHVLPEPFGRCFPQRPLAESGSSAEDEGQELGVPLDQTKVWRKLARKRQKKAAHFCSDAESAWLTLLWSTVTLPVIVVHYALFKRGTWLSERPDEPDESASTVFFCNPALNPAAKACSSLADMVLDTEGISAWRAYGAVLSWPQPELCFLQWGNSTENCLSRGHATPGVW